MRAKRVCALSLNYLLYCGGQPFSRGAVQVNEIRGRVILCDFPPLCEGSTPTFLMVATVASGFSNKVSHMFSPQETLIGPQKLGFTRDHTPISHMSSIPIPVLAVPRSTALHHSGLCPSCCTSVQKMWNWHWTSRASALDRFRVSTPTRK